MENITAGWMGSTLVLVAGLKRMKKQVKNVCFWILMASGKLLTVPLQTEVLYATHQKVCMQIKYFQKVHFVLW